MAGRVMVTAMSIGGAEDGHIPCSTASVPLRLYVCQYLQPYGKCSTYLFRLHRHLVCQRSKLSATQRPAATLRHKSRKTRSFAHLVEFYLMLLRPLNGQDIPLLQWRQHVGFVPRSRAFTGSLRSCFGDSTGQAVASVRRSYASGRGTFTQVAGQGLNAPQEACFFEARVNA
jgi:hypothetical protein